MTTGIFEALRFEDSLQLNAWCCDQTAREYREDGGNEVPAPCVVAKQGMFGMNASVGWVMRWGEFVNESTSANHGRASALCDWKARGPGGADDEYRVF
jgi:hypothetical protein